MTRLKYPIRIYIEITTRCNFNCVHCYLGDSKGSSPEDISLSLFKKAVQEMEDIGIFKLIVGGGEPLMHPKLSSLLQCLSGYRILPAITTNGYFVDTDFIDTLKSTGFGGSVQVSIHGKNPETHNRLVGHPQGYQHAMNAIKKLASSNVHVSTATAATRWNVNEIPSLLKELEIMGVKSFNIVFLMLVGRATTDLMLLPHEQKELLTFIHALKKRHTVFTDYNLSFESVDHLKKNPLFPHYCTCGVAHATIDPGGSVFPCSLLKFPQFSFGNLKNKTLKEIFDTPKNDTMREIYGVSPPECKGCTFEDVCKGGCRAIAFDHYGKLLAPDIRCLKQVKP